MQLPPYSQRIKNDLLWAFIICILAALTAILVNIIRENSLPFIAEDEYKIFVPCPEPSGEVSFTTIEEVMDNLSENTLLVDARSKELFEEGHLPDAVNIPFDFLYPLSEEDIQILLDRAPNKIIVYGDTDRVNIGEQQAKIIASEGFNNVFFIDNTIDQMEPYFVMDD